MRRCRPEKTTKGRISMISLDILNNNLNDSVSYYDFFKALGYSDRDKLFLRWFKDKYEENEPTDPGHKGDCLLKELTLRLGDLHNLNKGKNFGIFYVVNGGGQDDKTVLKNVKRAKAQFIDGDDLSFEDQVKKVNEFGIDPSIIVKTGRSLHCYWLLDDEAQMTRFRPIQAGLIKFFESDIKIKNESRVMRLYGFEHRKHDPILVKLIKFDPDLRYSQREIVEKLISHGIDQVDTTDEKKDVGQMKVYDWNDTLPETGTQDQSGADLALFDRNNAVRWFDQFCHIHKIERLQRVEKSDSDGDRKVLTAVVCPWQDQHSANTGRGQSAVIIHQSGAISYVCQHSHCAERTWKDYRSFYEQRDSSDPRSEETNGSSTGESSTGSAQNGSQGDSGSEKSEETTDISDLKSCVVSDFISSGEFDQAIRYFTKYQDRKTGFSNIDRYLTLYPGLACLTGSTSLGKTSFAVQLCDQLVDRGETVLFFTLEQLPIEIVTKSLARRLYLKDHDSPIDNIKIKNGVTTAKLEEVKKEYVEVSKRFHIIESDFRITAGQIDFYVRKFIQDTGIKPIVVVDYLQLISAPEGKKFDDRERIDDAVKKLKLLSKDNELFVLMISNMSRATYRERIGEDSFKESGLIEYTCDYLFGLQLSILEDDSFFTKQGSRGGEKETQKSEKQNLIDQASEAIPKAVVFKCLKNRNGKKTWKAFFKYRPDFDFFEVDHESKYDPNRFTRVSGDDVGVPFKEV